MSKSRPIVELSETLLTVEDLAAILSFSTREIWRREAAGSIPRGIRLGRKTVRWKASTIEQYLAELRS